MSNMKPAGYLNKFTGMIWNPEQQPGAESEPEIYEHLVRLSDVHGLVAENAALKGLIEMHAGGFAVCPNCSHEEPSETDDVVALYRSTETPATDAAIAEIGAKAIDMFAAWQKDLALQSQGDIRHAYVGSVHDANKFAANLRAGRKG